MALWQRRARLFIAVFVVAFAAVVFFAFQRRGPAAAAMPGPAATAAP